MKVFIVGSSNNLKIFNEKLGSEFPNLEITGTNSLMNGIDTVKTRHVAEEYDMMLIINQNFMEEDLVTGLKISKKFNDASKFALKDLPIFILVNADNKKLEHHLKTNLVGNNIRLFPYRKLTIEVVKEALKEAIALFKSTKTNKEEIRELVQEEFGLIKEKEESSRVSNYFNETLEKSRLRSVAKILDEVINNNELNQNNKTVVSINEVVNNIKTKVFKEEPATSINENPTFTLIDQEELSNVITPDNISDMLTSTDSEYNTLTDQKELVTVAIERVQVSDRPNKKDEILELYKLKKELSTEMGTKKTHFTMDIIEKLQEFILSNSSKNLESVYDLIDEIKAGHLVDENMGQSELLKKVKLELKTKIENDVTSQQLTRKKILGVFEDVKSELIETISVDPSLIEYANKDKIILPNELLKTDNMPIQEVNKAIENVSALFNKYDGEQLELLKSFDQLEVINEEIIDKQDKTIDILKTQKVTTTLKVDNELKSKGIFILGLDKVGKSFIGYNLAKAISNKQNVLLVDLTESGNLSHYLKQDKISVIHSNLNNITGMQTLSEIVKKFTTDKHLTVVTCDKGNTITLNQVEENLINLSSIFESIIVLMPTNLSSFKSLMDNASRVVLISEPEPTVLEETKEYVSYLEPFLSKTLIKNFILNKSNKKVPISIEELLMLSGINSDEFKIQEVIKFENALVSKFLGLSLYEKNELAKSTFDNLARKIK